MPSLGDIRANVVRTVGSQNRPVQKKTMVKKNTLPVQKQAMQNMSNQMKKKATGNTLPVQKKKYDSAMDKMGQQLKKKATGNTLPVQKKTVVKKNKLALPKQNMNKLALPKGTTTLAVKKNKLALPKQNMDNAMDNAKKNLTMRGYKEGGTFTRKEEIVKPKSVEVTKKTVHIPKKKDESHVGKKKRKETGSAARRAKREKVKKEISNMGIFKELKKDQATRSQ